MIHEQWRPVIRYEGFYEVSNIGRVRSLDHIDSLGRFRPGRIRKTPIDSSGSGYRFVTLSRAGKVTKCNVHVLVLEAFIGSRPSPRHECCHGDGDRTNASLSNLRWDTPESNHLDRWRHGTEHAGEKSPVSILTDETVRLIRQSPLSSLKLAPILGVASSTIRAVRIGQNWGHLKATPLGEAP